MWRCHPAPAAAASQSRRFPLIFASEMRPNLTTNWLIKNLIPRTGFGTIYGQPAAGKTFVALHAALHIASGTSYAGHKVSRAGVVYIAAEGQGGFINRVWAAMKALELNPAQSLFAVITVAPNLGAANGEVAELIQDIEAQTEAAGWKPGVVIIDTLAKVTQGADENSSQGMEPLLRMRENSGGNSGRSCITLARTMREGCADGPACMPPPISNGKWLTATMGTVS